MYRILNASRRVERELDKIPPRDFEKVVSAINRLTDNPHPLGVQKLTRDTFRIRVGRYRVIYVIDDAEQVVVITKVTKRTERTYKSF